MRVRTKVLIACALIALVFAGAFLGRRPPLPRSGDPDADGRFQVATWSGAGADGAPAVLNVFIGASVGDFDSVQVAISVPDEGLIGSFSKSAPDLLDTIGERVAGERPTIVWDLSTYPPGTAFTITTKYVDAKTRVLDTETLVTTRPAKPPAE